MTKQEHRIQWERWKVLIERAMLSYRRPISYKERITLHHLVHFAQSMMGVHNTAYWS